MISSIKLTGGKKVLKNIINLYKLTTGLKKGPLLVSTSTRTMEDLNLTPNNYLPEIRDLVRQVIGKMAEKTPGRFLFVKISDLIREPFTISKIYQDYTMLTFDRSNSNEIFLTKPKNQNEVEVITLEIDYHIAFVLWSYLRSAAIVNIT